ncbi:hypothetical protein Trihar35433_2006 [Trichoderma harzianum]|nr:hypothetical protein Trihar35433_2006 [Trichoderma harzianum]
MHVKARILYFLDVWETCREVERAALADLPGVSGDWLTTGVETDLAFPLSKTCFLAGPPSSGSSLKKRFMAIAHEARFGVTDLLLTQLPVFVFVELVRRGVLFLFLKSLKKSLEAGTGTSSGCGFS